MSAIVRRIVSGPFRTSSNYTRTADGDIAPADDVVSSSSLIIRSGVDLAPAGDLAFQNSIQTRTGDDTAPADDVFDSSSFLIRSADGDAAPVSGVVASSATLIRSIPDSAPAVDDGQRLPLTLARSGADDIQTGALNGAASFFPLDGSALDISGGNDGTLQGTATWSTDSPVAGTKSLAPGGTGSGYVYVPPTLTSAVAGKPVASASGWMKLDAMPMPGQYPSIITEHYPSGTDISLCLMLQATSAVSVGEGLIFGFYDGNPGGPGWLATPGVMPSLGVWQHWAGTYDGTTLRLYLNGVEVSSAAIGARRIPPGGGGYWLIGRQFDLSAITLNGKISRVGVFPYALTPAQISTQYTAPADLSSDTAVRTNGIFSRTGGDTAPADDLATQNSIQARTADGDLAPAGDVPTSPVLALRDAPDDIFGITDLSTQNSSQYRDAPEDISGIEDSTTQNTSQARTGTDSASVTDLATQNSTQFRDGVETVPDLTDDLARTGTFGRAGDDTAPTVDATIQNSSQFRDGSDAAPATDQTTRNFTGSREVTDDESLTTDSSDALAFHYRSVDEPVGDPTDGVDRYQSLVRVLGDSSLAVDDGTRQPITFSRTSTDSVPESTDDPARVGSFFGRAADDLIPVLGDDLDAHKFFFKESSDFALAGDSLDSEALLYRVTDDDGYLTDDSVHLTVLLRSVAEDPTFISDALETLRRSVRQVDDDGGADDSVWSRSLLDRQPGESAEVSDFSARLGNFSRLITDEVPEVVEGLISVRTKFRRALEEFGYPDDWSYARIGNDYRLLPRIRIVSITHDRLGPSPGFDTTTVRFFFDLPVIAWMVRLDAENHVDGIEIGRGSGSYPIQYGSITIPSSVLRRGSNTFTVFGQSMDGIWTR